MTTVELQKSGSRLLKLSPKRILDVRTLTSEPVPAARSETNVPDWRVQIAESLYQKGFVSYPRTETDQFDPQFDCMDLVNKQTTDAQWGQFATMWAFSAV